MTPPPQTFQNELSCPHVDHLFGEILTPHKDVANEGGVMGSLQREIGGLTTFELGVESSPGVQLGWVVRVDRVRVNGYRRRMDASTKHGRGGRGGGKPGRCRSGCGLIESAHF